MPYEFLDFLNCPSTDEQIDNKNLPSFYPDFQREHVERLAMQT